MIAQRVRLYANRPRVHPAWTAAGWSSLRCTAGARYGQSHSGPVTELDVGRTEHSGRSGRGSERARQWGAGGSHVARDTVHHGQIEVAGTCAGAMARLDARATTVLVTGDVTGAPLAGSVSLRTVRA